MVLLQGFSFVVAGQTKTDSVRQIDVIDVIHRVLHKKEDSAHVLPKKLNFSFIPSVGYTLTTGFAADLAGNVAFFTSGDHRERLSAIEGDVAYDTRAQRIFVIQSIVWAKNNDWKFVSDLRWLRFPQSTYGLGTSSHVDAQGENPLDFNFVKIYGTAYRRVVSNLYLGLGFKFDYHYKISQQGNRDRTISDLYKYGLSSQSQSTGVNIDILWDTRQNPINASQANYLNISYRENNKFTGSRSDWRSLQIDARKYIKLSATSKNILALWSIAWLTKGSVPYLDLPFTGGDVYNNTGRGYAEGHFRGKNMLYLEGEYRFGITRNGLLGGVAFANAQSFAEYSTGRFTTIAPAYGAGLRIKLNKHSATNVCLDYGIGIYGSRGLFVNLGEVF